MVLDDDRDDDDAAAAAGVDSFDAREGDVIGDDAGEPIGVAVRDAGTRDGAGDAIGDGALSGLAAPDTQPPPAVACCSGLVAT